MARRTRWSNVVHSFRAGILSPSAQDQIDSDAFLQGAARLDNLNVERDGGVTGRPAFVRSGIEPPQPRYDLLTGQTFVVDPGTGRSSAGIPSSPILRDQDYLAGENGIHRIDPEVRWLSYAARTTAHLLSVPLIAGGAPRAITFHDIVIRQGSWRGQEGGFDRLNLRVRGRRRSSSPSPREFYFDADPEAAKNEDPFLTSKLAPGLVVRDIVVRLIPDGEQEPTDLEWVAIRFARSGAASSSQPFEMSIGGVSCFSDTGPAEALMDPNVLDRPYRIIPWVIRNESFALVLGMDWVSMLHVGQDGTLTRREGDSPETRGVWHFTRRQLRELTWATYGGNLLLLHHDFPHPLEVHLPSGTRLFGITPLDLKSVPQLSADAIGRIAPEISRAGALIQVAPGLTRFPQVTSYTLEPFPSGLRVRWTTTGADSYKLYWTTRASYDTETSGGIAWDAINSPTAQSVIVSGAATQHDVTGLTSGTEYAVAVVSRIGTSESGVGFVQLGVAAYNQLGQPQVTASTGAVDASIALDWPDIPVADRYVVQWRSGSQSYSNARQQVVTTSAFNRIFTLGETFIFRVQAQVSAGTAQASPWSADVSRQSYRRDPGAPSGLMAVTATRYPSAVNLSWTAGTNADSYDLERRVSGQTSTTSETSGSNSFRWEGLPAGSHEFRVRARRNGAENPSAWTGWSTAVAASASTIVPPLATPQILNPFGFTPDDDAPYDHWRDPQTGSRAIGRYWFNLVGPVSGATGYEIQWQITERRFGSERNNVLQSGSFTFASTALMAYRGTFSDQSDPPTGYRYNNPTALHGREVTVSNGFRYRVRATAAGTGTPPSSWSEWFRPGLPAVYPLQ